MIARWLPAFCRGRARPKAPPIKPLDPREQQVLDDLRRAREAKAQNSEAPLP